MPRPSPGLRPRTAAGLLLAPLLTLAACGSSGGGDTASAPAPGSTPSATSGTGASASAPASTVEGGAAEASPLPAVDVVDVGSGETVALASLLPSDRPTLVWMWAPH